MEFETIALIIGIIAAVAVCFFVFIHMIKNKNINTKVKSTVNINALIEALGTAANILEVKSTPSKVSVKVKDHDIVEFDRIKSLGASGIVETKDSIAMIFGRESALIEEDIRNIIG